MKILVDMNLSPDWVRIISRHGWPAEHWCNIGDHHAPDREIFEWARTNKYVVFTHDLGFGAMLAVTHATGPSVVQVRAKGVLPRQLESQVALALRHYEHRLTTGALVVVEQGRNRVRVLPI
ncbi:MAG: DUF5615 family PIN-like protein [Candidatus Hydrogenedentales bacterium]